MNLIKVLKALSDLNRLRILNLLKYQDLCVCELEVLLDLSQSNASRHLNILSNAGLVQYYKVSKYVYYTMTELSTKEFPFLNEILWDHTKKLDQCTIDNNRLQKYKESGMTCDDLVDGKVSLD